MNRLIFASLSLILTAPALAEERMQFYDNFHAPTGSAVRNGNTVQFYDEFHAPTGSITIQPPTPPLVGMEKYNAETGGYADD